MNERIYDMLVIGGGPGGYTAALYAARAGMSVAVLEKLAAGGQMAESPQIDNYPGLIDGIDGFSLGMQMQSHAEKFGAETHLTEVTKLDLTDKIKTAQTDSGIFKGRTVVIATGATPKKLNIPGEAGLTGRGVHYCASCDGMFYRNKVVAVVGGGNTAAADALLLSRIAQKVILIHRRDSLRASRVYHKPLMDAENVEFHWNSVLTEIRPGEIVVNENEVIPCDGVFVAIGRQPETELVKDSLHLDENGYILAGESTATNLPGAYAVGDVRVKGLRQIITAAADGAVAVHQAEQYLAEI